MTVLFDELPTNDNHLIGIITLNSPHNLNALSYPMALAMYQQLIAWENNPKVVCVLLRSSLPKAFCAGGDIKQIVESCRKHPGKPDLLAEQFFGQEYKLDNYLHHYAKPIIGWGEGYVLGGGMGLLQACQIRIVTPSSKLAMPEMMIGLFPDVGAAWFLTRIPQKLGLFLALTASQVNANDALAIGWADRFMINSQQAQLLEGLLLINWQQEGEQALQQLLKQLEQQALSELPEMVWQKRLTTIRDILDQPDLPAICNKIQTFQQSNDSFLQKAAQNLAKGCPMTAWLIWEQFKRFARCSIAEVLAMDYTIAQHCCMNADFLEGVRALLIDKDNQPQWSYKTVADVPYEEVIWHFQLC